MRRNPPWSRDVDVVEVLVDTSSDRKQRRPDYRADRHAPSMEPCPWCGCWLWVDFGEWESFDGREAMRLLSPAWVDFPEVGPRISECIHCGTVVS